jgi:hypothetical protein
MKAVILILIIVVITGVGACSDENVISPTDDKLPISMVVELEETIVWVGDWISARILLTTDSDSAIVLDFDNSCRIGYEVLSGLKEVMAYPIGCTGEPGTLTVRNWGTTVIWFGLPTTRYDMENTVKNGVWKLELDQLPAGEYRLRAGLVGYKRQLPWAEAQFTVKEWKPSNNRVNPTGRAVTARAGVGAQPAGYADR